MNNEIDRVSKYDISKAIAINTRIIEEDTKILYTSNKIILILDGKATIKINEKEYGVKKNTVINITPWTIVEINNIESDVKCIVLSYNRLFLIKAVSTINSMDLKLFSDLDKHELIYTKESIGKEIKRIMLSIREEIGDENILEISEYKQDNFTMISVLSKLIVLIVTISRNLDDNLEKSTISLGQSIIKYIYAHASEKLTIVKLATIFFVSESTVRRYIEEFSGLTFNELLYKIRLQKSEELILYTNMNLDDIAKISGFVDGSHITKVWNMKKNMSPAAYRQTYRSSFITSSEEDKNKAFLIIDYIDKNYMKEILIETVAKQFDITEVKVNKLLLIHVDRNFSSYLNYVRINKACYYLESTEEPIIDICFKVGYNNIKTFNNNFKKYKHITPTEFKKGDHNYDTPSSKA